ncbi:KH domain-containing protein [Candidatus Saccharibacteria bacterium]|nr:KH domain-containing protein [Candidatus Saccharibacteria bacterium]
MAETIDQQFVEYIVKTLAGEPDKVIVTRTTDDRGVLLTLEVAPDDLGRVIGKKGVNAQSIRTLLRALGMKNDARYNLKIASDDDYTPPVREDREGAPAPLVEASETEITEEPAEESNELAEKTRAELADLDDLDI